MTAASDRRSRELDGREPSAHEPNLVLVGFTGAGKSTVAARLGPALQRPVLDVDVQLEARVGPLADYVARHGVEAFRAVEREVVAALPTGGVVIASGAGTVLHRATRARLTHHARVCYLEVSAATLAARLAALPAGARHRPDLVGPGAALRIREELARRAPIYASLGHRIDGEASPEVVAREILGWWGQPRAGG